MQSKRKSYSPHTTVHILTKNGEKTIWQKIYSFFGFWTYHLHQIDGSHYLVIYWCMFPWFKFIRKFDVLRLKC